MVVKYGSVPSRCTIKFGPVFYFHLNSYDEHINSVQVFCGYFLCDVTILEVAILKRKREKKKLLFGLLQTVLKKKYGGVALNNNLKLDISKTGL